MPNTPAHKTPNIRTVSVFSGAGGLDIGAIQAGADIVWANDIMKEACLTYRENIGDHIVCGDINDKIHELKGIKDISLVIGGPPCQGFSVAGKMDENDQRSKLVWAYLSVLKIVKPDAFIMENVKALGTLKRWQGVREKLLKEMRALGYSVNYMVLNASEYDVPQSRERVFFVGFKGNPALVPDIHSMVLKYGKQAPHLRKVLMALDKAGTGNNTDTCRAKITLAQKPVLRSTPYAGMLFNGLGRPLRLDGYAPTLSASMGGNKTPILDENELYSSSKPWVESYFEEILHNPAASQSTTIPQYLRRISVAEAALIQTFPIGYKFQGSQSMRYTQIGNAVPCKLANAVSRMVINVITGKDELVFLPYNNQVNY